MLNCTECKEKGKVTAFYDSYDNEVHMRCERCGRRVTSPVCLLCGEELMESEYAFLIEKDIYCTNCVKRITV